MYYDIKLNITRYVMYRNVLRHRLLHRSIFQFLDLIIMKKISDCFCPTFFSISQSTQFLILLFLPLSQHVTMNIDKSLYFLLPLFFSTVPLLSLFICFFSSSQYIPTLSLSFCNLLFFSEIFFILNYSF